MYEFRNFEVLINLKEKQMKKLFVVCSALLALATISCKKSASTPSIPSDLPRTNVPAALTGNWMHGAFSLTEYWSTDPSTYLGNALEIAFAFTFNSDGTYVQYFTASSVINGVTTYHQSVTHGTVEVDETTKTIVTHPAYSHYRRTSDGSVEEDRDMRQDELGDDNYDYETGNEPNGSAALYLTPHGTEDTLTFLKQQ